MGDTYARMYFHVIIHVKRSEYLIDKSWKEELNKYITAIVTDKKQKMMIINGVENHIHMLIGAKPNCFLPDLLREIKCNSSKWINEKKFLKTKFEWAGGYSVFTVGYSQAKVVINYIKNQEEHHRKITFEEEYIEFLNDNDIDFKEKYVF